MRIHTRPPSDQTIDRKAERGTRTGRGRLVKKPRYLEGSRIMAGLAFSDHVRPNLYRPYVEKALQKYSRRQRIPPQLTVNIGWLIRLVLEPCRVDAVVLKDGGLVPGIRRPVFDEGDAIVGDEILSVADVHNGQAVLASEVHAALLLAHLFAESPRIFSEVVSLICCAIQKANNSLEVRIANRMSDSDWDRAEQELLKRFQPHLGSTTVKTIEHARGRLRKAESS